MMTMRGTKILARAALAALMLGGAALVSAEPAQAQVEFRFGGGPDFGPRRFVDVDEPYGRRYRRERRVIVEDDDVECRVIIRRRINRFGEPVEVRRRVCN